MPGDYIGLDAPCPFCAGTRGVLDRHTETGKWSVICISCAAMGPWGRSQRSAIDQWNRRPVMENGRTVLRRIR